MINLNKGDSNMSNELSKDIDKLILKYGLDVVKNAFSFDKNKEQAIYSDGILISDATISASRLVANSEVKAPKIKYHPLPTYVGTFPVNNPLSIFDVEYGEFIGSDVVFELDDGQEITIPYKEQYDENSKFKEYIERSVQHAYKVLNKAH